MKHAGFRFSLATFIGIGTLAAVMLGMWLRRVEMVSPSMKSKTVIRGAGGTYREPAQAWIQEISLRTATGDHPVHIKCVVIAPLESRTKMSMRWAGGPEPLQTEMAAAVGVIQPDDQTVIHKLTVTLLHDARRKTVSLGEETNPASDGAIHVVRIDDQWQPHLILDKGGDLSSVDIPEDIREELLNFFR